MVYYLGDISREQAAELNARSCPEYAAEKVNSGDAVVAFIGKCGEAELSAVKSARRKSVVTFLYPTDGFEPTGDLYESSEIILLSEHTAELCTGICPDCEVNLALAAKKLRGYGATNIVITVTDVCTAVIVGQEITLVPAAEAADRELNVLFAAEVASKLSAGNTLIDSIKKDF